MNRDDELRKDAEMVRRVKEVISAHDLDAASRFYDKELEETARLVILEVVDALCESYELKRIE